MFTKFSVKYFVNHWFLLYILIPQQDCLFFFMLVVVDKVLGASTTEIIGAHSKDIISDVVLKCIKPMS